MRLKGKRLLVVGAGRGQVDLIKTAQQKGCYVLVVTHADHYPGVALADKVCYADIRDAQAVCRIAQQEQVDGVVTACLDTGVEAVGYTCDSLGLPGVSYETARRSNDKLLMKQVLVEAGVPTAPYRLIRTADELNGAINEMTFPLVLKAVDLQGSRGIYICRSKQEVLLHYDEVMQQTEKEYCLLEEFISGTEFGAEAFVQDGKVLFVLPNGKNNYLAATGVPVGHFAPLDRDEAFIAKAKDIVCRAIHAMKMDNCAVNVDLIERDGNIYVIELTCRVGANCLPELVSLYYGINYYEMIIACALGQSAESVFNKRTAKPVTNASRMLSVEKSGIVRSIVNHHPADDPSVYAVTFFVKEGDAVRKFQNSNDCVAQVVVTGETYADCEKTIAELKQDIEIVLQ